MPKPETINVAEVASLEEKINILLVTATEVETAALNMHLRPLPEKTNLLTVTVGKQTYHIGVLGKYGIVHVQCQMGSVLPGASSSTVEEAIAQWNVKAVVMVGIAFGIAPKKQRIGDVLISKTIIPYEIKRIGAKANVPRGPIPPCGSVLLNRFTNCTDWSFELPRKQKSRIMPAQMLSGESLIDNREHLHRLHKTFPQADGGEMEGAGVFAAAHKHQVEWILVKGICDFADGKKGRGKKGKQDIAAKAAASLCCHVFSQAQAFAELQCPDILDKQSCDDVVEGAEIENVLFEVYEQSKESAYLERKVDGDICDIIQRYSIWVSGASGSGKTTAIKRNLLKRTKEYIFVDLSRCVGDTVSELFSCLYSDIAEGLGAHIECESHKRLDFRTHIDNMAELLQTNVKRPIFIFIDELPLDKQETRLFFDGVSAIIICLANRGFHKVRFLIATIGDFKEIFPSSHSKLSEHIRPLQMHLWTKEEITGLLQLILRLIDVDMQDYEKTRILAATEGSPRKLKNILKGWCMFRGKPEWTLERIILEAN